MCNIGGPCPDEYTLSAGTKTCYKITSTDGSGYTDGCQLPNNSIFVTPDGEVLYRSSEPICGFEFDAYTSGAITGATGGDAEDAGLTVGAGAVTVLGFGLAAECFGPATGACTTFTTAGCGTLVNIGTTAPITYIDNPTFSTCGGGNLPMTIVSGATTASTTTIILTQNSDPLACKTKFTLLELEGYKKTFQSFWVQFVEQFVPATTIFVSGERWCNRPDDICTQYDECDFDFEFVEGDVTTIPNGAGLTPPVITSGRSQSYVPNNGNESRNVTYPPLDYESTENGPINRETVKINPLPKENGETMIEPSNVGDIKEREKRKLLYQDRLQTTQTIIE